MQPLRARALIACLIAPALLACDKPVPPSWPTADNAIVVEPSGPIGLDSDLSALSPLAVAKVAGPTGAVLRVAYDGARLVGELRTSVAVSAGAPIIVYMAAGAGSERVEYRLWGKGGAAVYVNGDVFTGTAPRVRSAPGVHRFYLPTLGGDAAIHVVGGPDTQPLAPTVVLNLSKGGGFRWSRPQAATVIGVRAVTEDGRVGLDQPTWEPGATIALLGARLDEVTALEIGALEVELQPISPERVVFTAPAEGGTDTVSAIVPSGALDAVRLPVEGLRHKIDAAMTTFVDSVWGTWLVLLLVGAGLILTIITGFPQFRGFGHAIAVIRGRYDNPDEKGEITHFQALTAALSATVGLGNIAGVAVAVTKGGPGALFWMWVCGFLGMATKYSECTLATATREVREDGTVAGGPMYTMWKELHRYLKPMAFIFATFITIASFGGGNMFQANQAAALWHTNFGVPTEVTGLILVALVGLVIVGGIKRIGRVTDKLVPTMCGLYVLGALVIIFANIEQVPDVFGMIFSEAFSVSAAVGGVLGIVIKDVLVQGFRRAAFSNEAGFGSAAIAHAAVKTDEPVREGVVALLEPFIDTIVICTMTGLVIIISGLWTQQGLDGAPLTAAAFDSAFDGFGSILVPIAVFLFAISTMISWSYYGEKGVEFVLGRRAVTPYRLVFVGLIFVGAVWELGPVLSFSDGMLGLVAVPNLIAVMLLAPKLRRLTKDYFGRLKSGDMARYK